MASESDGRRPAAHRGSQAAAGPGAATAEIAGTLAIFAAVAAWPVPDVNETVYLPKALHHFDPAYGGGDWFLQTPDAHSLFYVLMGPIVAAFGLDHGAWVGRWLGWLALAWGFRHAVAPLLAGTPWRLLAAWLFSLALRHTTVAGEWVIGGCESKVFAWALVLPAIGEVARGRFATAWFLMGGATALNAVVGAWGIVALGITRWRAGRDALAGGTDGHPTPAPFRAVMLLGGLALAAWGTVPLLALSTGVDAAGRAAADRVYVVDRLYHHLLPWAFPEAMIARHLLAILVGAILHRAVPQTPARSRAALFQEAAVSISLAGCLIAAAEPLAPDLAIRLLRFYWFRLADGVVPFALAASATAMLADDAACGRTLPGRPALVRMLVAAALLLDLGFQSRHWPLPGRVGLTPRGDAKVDAPAWADVCGWVRDHVPAGSRFLTPRGAASFTWRTGLPEVVSWKNSPQDAVSLLEWKRRILDCFSADGRLGNLERSTAALGAARMEEVAARYGADHAIVPLDVPGLDTLPFERLHANQAYAVYRLAAPVQDR